MAVACMLSGTAGAATIEVTTAKDELDTSPDAKCSLREAVQSANTNTAVGGCPKGSGPADTIELAKARYALTIPTPSPYRGAVPWMSTTRSASAVLMSETAT